MNRALVLSGGGARGAYELGAWEALEEMGVRFDGVYGTSIGALNAGLYAQGDLPLAKKLWSEIGLSQIVRLPVPEEEVPTDFTVYNKLDLLPLLVEHRRLLRLDPAPLERLLAEHLNEGRVRASGLSLGVMTVRLPQMTPMPMRLKGMPAGQLNDWLMASAACFPVFAEKRIGGEAYIDGGYFDNLPVDMAIEDGAQESVAVDIHPNPAHAEYARLPFLKVIHPLHPLGGFLDFTPETLERSRRLGESDALKAYGRLDGIRYSFRALSDMAWYAKAVRFSMAAARFDARAITRRAFHADQTHTAPLLGALSRETPLRALSYKDIYLRGLELAAQAIGFREDTVYDCDALAARMLAFARAQTPPLPRDEAGLKAIAQDSRALLRAAYALLCDDGECPPERTPALSQYPEVTAGAMALRNIGG